MKKKVILLILIFFLSTNVVQAKELDLIAGSENELLYKIDLEEDKYVDTGVEDKFGWTLYVDGYKIDKKVVNKIIGADLSKGLHTIYLKYEFPFIHEITIALCVFLTTFSIKRAIEVIKEKETI